MHDLDQTGDDVDRYLERHQQKELLRFVAVGSVDDGKSTLIGRLLHDSHGLYQDQVESVARASRRAGMEIDFSLFTDGLKAEREQGITIDVAYRYFSTAKRKFIIADTPGHVQYTRNMATGASTADVAIILIDARLGVLQQSRRHAYIASLLGIPRLVVCINKMDLEGHRQQVFDEIRARFAAFLAKVPFQGTAFIPVSALEGDNIVHGSGNMPWYDGPTLLQHLEEVPAADTVNAAPFRYPVQSVLRPDLDYRGYSGVISSGVVRRGDPVMVLPSGRTSRVAAIDTFDGELESAHAPMSVTVRLADDVDVSRGDMLVHPDAPPKVGPRFDAMLIWMAEGPLEPEKSYLVKQTTRVVRAQVRSIAYVTDLESLEPRPATALQLNDIGRVAITCHRPLFYDPYRTNRGSGAFIVIDPLSNATVAAGMILDEDGGGAGAELDSGEPAGGAVWLSGPSTPHKAALTAALRARLFHERRPAMAVDVYEELLGGRPDLDETGERYVMRFIDRAVDAGIVVVLSAPSPAPRGERWSERLLEIEVAEEEAGGDPGRAVDRIIDALASTQAGVPWSPRC